MKYILTPDQVRQADSDAINQYGIPSAILMENAARSASVYIARILNDSELDRASIIILCGCGNNGGDGFAVARHLFNNGFDVAVFWFGDETRMSNETKTNFKAAAAIGIPVNKIDDENSLQQISFACDCIIDAMVGVGGSENITGIALSVLKKLQYLPALRIAIDVPTGLNSLTGATSEFCFMSDFTITMFAGKTGMYINNGPDYCGITEIADLGAPPYIVSGIADTASIESVDKPELLPQRRRRASKFDFGRLMVIAGSGNFPGAAAMTANAAVTAGAGLTNLISPMLHPSVLPDVISTVTRPNANMELDSTSAELIFATSSKSTATVIGPGLGNSIVTAGLVTNLLDKLPKNLPVVLDADGLRAVRPDKILRENIIITPHVGEFSRITGLEEDFVRKNALPLAKEWAEKLNCIILLKGVPTVITDGKFTYLNTTGNPALSKGGSGDVLSGIIGALLAQGTEPLEAAALGAYLHGAAADRYISKYSEHTLTSADLIRMLKYIMNGR